jgi:hypothetical protein
MAPSIQKSIVGLHVANRFCSPDRGTYRLKIQSSAVPWRIREEFAGAVGLIGQQ